jgi:DNA repair protein RadD
MELRPHQEKAVEMLRESLRQGNRRPMLAAPCSFGKTITAAALLKSALEKGKRGIFICDRIKLVSQTLEQFDKQGLPFGVMQGNHELTDPNKPIQVASIQTLARRRNMPAFDFAIVDEAHTHYKHLTKMMEAYNNVIFVGLSATPMSKGLGRHYDDLVVPITTEELLELGYLCPVEYYGGREVNTAGVKSKALPTGGSDFDPLALAEAAEKDDKLVGDIVGNWLKHAAGRQTIAFSPSIKHSKGLVQEFINAGIPAAHIDGYMKDEERQRLYEGHDNGEFLVLSCSKLLNTGYDAPSVSCLIDCRPTKSKIVFCQTAGRIFRTAENKEKAIYLDHSGNINRHGFPEFITPSELDTGEKRFSEDNQVKRKDKKVNNCPKCQLKMSGPKCACGFEFKQTADLHTDGSELVRLQKKANKVITPERKAEWYGELRLYAQTRGFKPGWAAVTYREKFGVWPNKIEPAKVSGMSDEVSNYIKHKIIKSRYQAMKKVA